MSPAVPHADGTWLHCAASQPPQATLHVPAAQANACLSAYGLTADTVQQAPALVSHAATHLLPEDTAADTAAGQDSITFAMASCMATPVEKPVSSVKNPLRTAAHGAVATRSMQKLSGAHESLSIVDRYGEAHAAVAVI